MNKLIKYKRRFFGDYGWKLKSPNGKVINSGNAGFNTKQNLDENIRLTISVLSKGAYEIVDKT